MPAPSLYSLAKARAIASIDSIEDVGDLPYAFVAPILRHLQSPDQLVTLERNCPQLQGETGELWLRFIKRDIPGWDKKPHEPHNPKNWHKVYAKLKREAEREKAAQEEKLRLQMKRLTEEKNKSTLIIEPGSRLARLVPKRKAGWGGSGGQPGPRSTGREALDKFKKGLFRDKNAGMARNTTPLRAPQQLGKVDKAPERLLRLNEAAKMDKAALDRAAGRGGGGGASAATTTATATTTKGGAPPQRPRLPEGQRFSVPKIRIKNAASSVPSTTSPPAASVTNVNANLPTQAVQKRKREEPNVFMQTKKRRV
ncbi:uncharacterized protein EI97DRAFT_233354 [Westerdykella ornata]|uniref:Elongin-A n=1 Tax=Westerdykella ornata TaxID=318751 RepID=A0A6A6J6I0_WESOR|nr:uncharacterized protein EI97DRAFT_233354 [Westerdykella ornata]KAF2272180.1 hypothetical protein EI97DRAFT_233354 [Westerdykella ornata]